MLSRKLYLLHSILRCKVIGEIYSSKVATAYIKTQMCSLSSFFMSFSLWISTSPGFMHSKVGQFQVLQFSKVSTNAATFWELQSVANAKQQVPNSDRVCCFLYTVREESTGRFISIHVWKYQEVFYYRQTVLVGTEQCDSLNLHESSTVYSTWVSRIFNAVIYR